MAEDQRPLSGIRVVDLSERSPAAAITAMVLAGYGAEVTHVEPPAGDELRALDATAVWLRGQRSVTVGDGGLSPAELDLLCARADVVLDTSQTWLAKPFTWTGKPDSNQVHCVLTAEPVTPEEAVGGVPTLPAYSELVESRFGWNYLQTGVREGPHYLAWPHAAYGCAWLAEIGILAALHARHRTGQGQVITTSLLEGLLILSPTRWYLRDDAADESEPGAQQLTRSRFVAGLFQCSDGRWVFLHTGARGAFNRLMTELGRDDLVDPEAGNSMWGSDLTEEQAVEMHDFVVRTVKGDTADHWFDRLSKIEVSIMHANDPGAVYELEQLERNGLVHDEDGMLALGHLAKMSHSVLTIDARVPTIGEHNDAVRQELQQQVAPELPGAKESQSSEAPLEDITLLDFGFFVAGPFADRMLADLGARVIKVEEVSGDPFRKLAETNFETAHRGKEDIAINLKAPEGRAIAEDLIRRADIVHYNMRLGAMERLGVGYEQGSALNPEIIYCHSSGYGNDGPWASLPAFEPLQSAVTGMLVRAGGPGNPPIMYIGDMDRGGGLNGAVGVLVALVCRDRTGHGQFVECPQLGAGMLAMSDVYLSQGQVHETFAVDSEVLGHAPTNGLYQTSDGWLTISCYSEREWEAVTTALGLVARDDFRGNRRQPYGSGADGKDLRAALLTMTTQQAVERLGDSGAAYVIPGKVTARDWTKSPLVEVGTIVNEQHPELGSIWEVGPTIRFGRSVLPTRGPTPPIGEDTRRILAEIGRNDGEVDDLAKSGVVAAR